MRCDVTILSDLPEGPQDKNKKKKEKGGEEGAFREVVRLAARTGLLVAPHGSFPSAVAPFMRRGAAIIEVSLPSPPSSASASTSTSTAAAVENVDGSATWVGSAAHGSLARRLGLQHCSARGGDARHASARGHDPGVSSAHLVLRESELARCLGKFRFS